MTTKDKVINGRDLNLRKLLPVINKYVHQDGLLIPILQETQRLYGYLPRKALEYISKKTKIPLAHIYGVATFYSQFHLKLRGKHLIKVCKGTACHVRGADEVLATLKELLGIEKGETTEDLKFTLEEVACLGVCYLAPVMMVDEHYHGKLDSERVKEILKKYIKSGG